MVILLLLLPFCADAQSVPNGGEITPGQVWTPSQWTNAWQSKLDTQSTGANLSAPIITNGTFNNSTINGGTISGIAITGDASSSTATSTGTTTALTLANRFSQVINVLDTGGHNDAVSFADGAIIASSTTFTSNKTTFTSVDVGKSIYIDGVGTNGKPLATTIAGFNSAHSVTLSASAITPATNSFATSAVPVTAQSGSGSYAPGDTVTLTGGTAVQQSVLTILTTKLVSATVNAGGSGGTNGTCILSGTTGTGRVFRLSATISGGAISAIGSTVDAGSYTVNPTSLAAEPVTGCSLTGATLTLKIGYSTGYVTTPGSYSVVPSNPVSQGSTSGSGTGATFTLQTNVGGTYVYGTDNTQAFSNAVARLNTLWSSGVHACIYMPSYDARSGTAGGYLVVSQPTQFAQRVPGCAYGDGPNKSTVILGASFNGHMFSTDDAWLWVIYPFGGSQPASANQAGPLFRDFTVMGNTLAGGEQDAFVFYDHNDFVDMRSINCINLHGMCIYGSALLNDPTAGVRESHFVGIEAWSDGTETKPAIYMTNNNGGVSDLYFSDINILRCYSTCLVFDDNFADTFGGTEGIRMYGVRVERSMNGDDLVVFGNTAQPGIVGDVASYGFNVEQTQVDHAGVRITSQSATYQPYEILFDDARIGGSGIGIQFDRGKGFKFTGIVDSSQTNIIVGPGLQGSAAFWLDNSGVTWSIDPSVAPQISYFRTSPGDPSALGNNAINLQPRQVAAANTASGGASVAIGDGSAIASNSGSIAIGQFANAAGSNAVAFGNSTTATNSRSFVSGVGTNDLGDIGHWVWESFPITSSSDNQSGIFLLIGQTTDATPLQLTVNAGPASTVNLGNLQNNSAFHGHVECSAFSSASGDLATWNDGASGTVIQRGANAAATNLRLGTLSSTYASAGASTWTVAESADTTNGGLEILATGAASTTIHWVCRFMPVELK